MKVRYAEDSQDKAEQSAVVLPFKKRKEKEPDFIWHPCNNAKVCVKEKEKIDCPMGQLCRSFT